MICTLLLSLGLWGGITTVSISPAQAMPVSRQDPEPASSTPSRISTASGSAVVVTAHPQASRAALAVLRSGGHAVDALVAAQAVLAVVEPQSSGLGGGGFLLHWDAQRRHLEALDGRETAPLTSRPGDLLDADGRALPWPTATRSLRAIGIPGTVALLWEAHQQHGRHPWADLFDPAIALARDGFAPSPRLLRSVALAQRLGVAHSPAFQQLYLPGGRAIQAGARLRNPVLANSLEQLARHGGPSFYRGDLARQILRELDALRRDEPGFRGWSPVDLTTYKVIRREPLCSGWRGYRLCSMPAPSSGGLAIQQTLALWDALGGESSLQQPASWRRLAAAMAWADADRLYWVRDPLDGAPWIPALLTPQYIVSRAGGMALDHHRRRHRASPPVNRAIPSRGQPQGEKKGPPRSALRMTRATWPATPHQWKPCSAAGIWWPAW